MTGFYWSVGELEVNVVKGCTGNVCFTAVHSHPLETNIVFNFFSVFASVTEPLTKVKA